MSFFAKLNAMTHLTPTADALRAEFAEHEKRMSEARASNAWIASFESEAEGIEREREMALQAHAQRPTQTTAERFVIADAKMPRAASLRLAVKAEAGRAQSPVSAIRISSLRGLLTLIEAHARQVGDSESAAIAARYEGVLVTSSEDVERWVARYAADATDTPKEKAAEKHTVVNVGYRGIEPTVRRNPLSRFLASI